MRVEYDAVRDRSKTIPAPAQINVNRVGNRYAREYQSAPRYNDYYAYFLAPNESSRRLDEVERSWQHKLERVAATGGVVTFTFHAMTSGTDDARFGIVERLLQWAQQDLQLEILTTPTVVTRFLRESMLNTK